MPSKWPNKFRPHLLPLDCSQCPRNSCCSLGIWPMRIPGVLRQPVFAEYIYGVKLIEIRIKKIENSRVTIMFLNNRK